MFLSGVLIASGALALGGKVYFDTKKKKKRYWAFYADKMAAKKYKSMSRGGRSAFGAFRKVKEKNLSSVYLKQIQRKDPQIAEMASQKEKADIDQDVKSADQHFAVSVASLGLAVTGTMLFPPLRLLGWMGYFYASAHFYKGAYHSIVYERKLKMVVVDAVMFTGILATGSLVAGTLMCSLIWLAEKLFAPRLRGD